MSLNLYSHHLRAPKVSGSLLTIYRQRNYTIIQTAEFLLVHEWTPQTGRTNVYGKFSSSRAPSGSNQTYHEHNKLL